MRKHGIQIIAIFVFMSLPHSASAWRETAHYTVCEIAYKLSSKLTKKTLDRFFEGQPYAVNCTWPDHVRKTKAHKHTYYWHFINVKDDGEYFDKVSKKGDLLQAIHKISDYLRKNRKKILNSKTPVGSFSKEVREQIIFLGHFVGDLHQPLHVGRLKDYGGNKIDVKWEGKETRTYEEYKLIHGGHVTSKEETRPHNLHKVVDLFIPKKYGMDKKFEVDETGLSYKAYANHLISGKASGVPKATKAKIHEWQNSMAYDWVNESFKLRKRLYDIKPKEELSTDYFAKNIELLNLRILQAGVRLAGVLDAILEKNQKPSKEENAIRKRIKKALKFKPNKA